MHLPRILLQAIMSNSKNPIVQYIVVRVDLSWPTGALIAQGAHSSTAAIHRFYEEETTKLYLEDLESMHKVVLKAENEEQLKSLVDRLKESNVKHHAWIEQPENMLVSVTTSPDYKANLQPYFKGFKLFA